MTRDVERFPRALKTATGRTPYAATPRPDGVDPDLVAWPGGADLP